MKSEAVTAMHARAQEIADERQRVAEANHRCDVCGELLNGECAEVILKVDAECSLARHLTVHEPCYNRDTMLQA